MFLPGCKVYRKVYRFAELYYFYLMAYNHHESENLADLFNCILSGHMLEQGNEYVFEPVCVKPLFFMENLENDQKTGIFKLSESSFH